MMRLAIALPLPLALAALWLASPLPIADLGSRPAPAAGFEESLRRIDAMRAAQPAGRAAECGSQLYSHHHRTARVIVLFHGLTNCPAQFDSLGRAAFERGANVFIPCLPRHGAADRMTDELSRLDPQELRAFTDRALDAARGLGDSMTVAGLSVGGTLATWAAQQRRDVDRAVLIAPMLGVEPAPGAWTPVVARLATLLPNLFVWWDPARKLDLPGPRHVYPRFATRSVAATLRVGAVPCELARHAAPACRSVAVVTVGGDPAVDNRLIAELVRDWRAHGAHDVETYEFPAALHLNHDIVDLEQVGGNPAITYPVLERLIGP